MALFTIPNSLLFKIFIHQFITKRFSNTCFQILNVTILACLVWDHVEEKNNVTSIDILDNFFLSSDFSSDFRLSLFNRQAFLNLHKGILQHQVLFPFIKNSYKGF